MKPSEVFLEAFQTEFGVTALGLSERVLLTLNFDSLDVLRLMLLVDSFLPYYELPDGVAAETITLQMIVDEIDQAGGSSSGI